MGELRRGWHVRGLAAALAPPRCPPPGQQPAWDRRPSPQRQRTGHPGHDALQQAQWHGAQDAPHHVALLRAAQRAHQHRQHVCGVSGQRGGDVGGSAVVCLHAERVPASCAVCSQHIRQLAATPSPPQARHARTRLLARHVAVHGLGQAIRHIRQLRHQSGHLLSAAPVVRQAGSGAGGSQRAAVLGRQQRKRRHGSMHEADVQPAASIQQASRAQGCSALP